MIFATILSPKYHCHCKKTLTVNAEPIHGRVNIHPLITLLLPFITLIDRVAITNSITSSHRTRSHC